MKKFLCVIALLGAISGVFGQTTSFKAPFANSKNMEPSRSEFLSYRRTSGTKGSPIDTALSFKKLQNWDTTTANNQVIASAGIIIPAAFVDKAIYLNVGATNGCATIYVNDVEVGSRSDSKLSSQFNISKYVERGMNRVKIVIEPEKNVDLIEQNPKLDLNLDEIYVFAQPKIRIFDITTRTSLDPTYKNGLLEIALILKTELLNAHTVTVYYDLFDGNGKLVNQASKDVVIDMRIQDTVRFTATIFDVNRWSHENPYLYTAEFKIKREGRFTEYMWRKVGFRTVETLSQQLVINGNATKIHGINAEIFPKLIQRTTSDSEMLNQLRELKYFGINAIVTPFPIKKSFYDIADSLGLYIIETTNINAKNTPKSINKGGTLSNDPSWRDVFVDRAVNTYEQAKVHPSVIAIATGRDAGNGYNMYQAYLAIKKRDNTRLVVNNDAGTEWNTDINLKGVNTKSPQPIILDRANDYSNEQGAFLDNNVTTEQIEELIGKRAVEVSVFDAAKGQYEITNNLKATNLSNIPCFYKVFNKNGSVSKSGTIYFDLPAGTSGAFVIPNASGKSIELTFGKVSIYRN